MQDDLARSEESGCAIVSELTGTKEVMTQNSQALADHLERSRVLEEELGQLLGTGLSVVTEVLGPRPALSGSADLSKMPSEVAGLITEGVFLGASGVLMSVASHHPTLDFKAVGRGYATGLSADLLRELGQGLVPITIVITEATTVEWVKEAHHVGGKRLCAEVAGSLQMLSRVPPKPS